MQTFALTGGIASGKTVVLEAIEEEFPAVETVEADGLAKEVYDPDNPRYEDVIDLLGPEALGPDGGVDRKKVAEMVFRDHDLLRRLEELTHPYVRERIEELIDHHDEAGTELLLVEIPLLFQSSEVDREAFDGVILVTVGRETRIERLMARDGISRPNAERRVERQALPEGAREEADYLIETECPVEETRRRAVELASRLLN